MGDYSDAGGAIRKFVIAVAVIVLLLVGGCGLVAGRLLGSDRIGRMDAAEGLEDARAARAEQFAKEEWVRNAPVRTADALNRIAEQGAELQPDVKAMREDIRAIRDELKALRDEVSQLRAAVNAPASS